MLAGAGALVPGLGGLTAARAPAKKLGKEILERAKLPRPVPTDIKKPPGRQTSLDAEGGCCSLASRAADDIGSLALRNITHSGDAVLGHFPGYINKANARGASHFDIRDAWNSLSDAERWLVNTHFLDTVADRGDRVLLSLPKTIIRAESYLAKEVQYLTSEKGYVWINQWALKPGG